MITGTRNLFLGLCLFVSVSASSAQTVSAVLDRMDKAAPSFHTMSAKLQMVTFTKVLDDKTVESGTLQMQKLRANDVRAIIEFTGQSDPRTIGFLGKKVRIYYPKLREYQEQDLGKYSNVLNSFLLLGFGSSGKELAQNYDIQLGQPEKVAGVDTAKLLLVPKDAAAREKLQKAEIWVPNDGANPVQQQFYEPSGNYRLVTYSDMTVNPPMKATLDLKLPPGTKRQSQ